MVNISKNFTTTQSLALNSMNQSSALLKVGQVLSANIEHVQGKQITLTIGNQILIATSKTDIQESGTIQVRVKQLQPTVELAIIHATKPNTTQQIQSTLQAAYRHSMPNQTALPQAFQQISLLQGLPASLLGPITQLLEQATKNASPLSGSALKDKMADSGLFLESKLKQPEKLNLSTDIKAQLLTLQKQTEALGVKTPSPQLSQLLSTLTQAINRLTVQQLQLYENPNITPLDLPYNHKNNHYNDHVEVRKNTQPEPEPSTWEVLINLHLPQGEISSKLTFNQQGEFNCFIWCETAILEQTILENITQLEQQFVQQDLKLQNVLIVKQKPSKTEQSTHIALIDIHI